jgi:hypothetical protein
LAAGEKALAKGAFFSYDGDFSPPLSASCLSLLSSFFFPFGHFREKKS